VPIEEEEEEEEEEFSVKLYYIHNI